MVTPSHGDPDTRCVEHGLWTPLPVAPPDRLMPLSLADVDAAEHARIGGSGTMTFHMVGCTGDFSDHAPQRAVASAMATQVQDPGTDGLRDGPATTASFLFHLGDVTYQSETPAQSAATASGDQRDVAQGWLYNDQLYAPYHGYGRRIFAIAGNHDGKDSDKPATSAIHHFLRNFCASRAEVSPDNRTDQRPAMTQPYPYWRLDTPLATILGLYTNVANGGILDDPATPDTAAQPQYAWLVAQLTGFRSDNDGGGRRKALLVAVHHPPYAGTVNFIARGAPTLGPTRARNAVPLATRLAWAFRDSGQRPDAIISAHIHMYQRLTYRYADGWEAPYLVVGSGGHIPIDDLWKPCDGGPDAPKRSTPFEAVLPAGHTVPAGDRVQVTAYLDQSTGGAFGFMRLTLAGQRLTGEYFAVTPGPLRLADSFVLDLDRHRLIAWDAASELDGP